MNLEELHKYPIIVPKGKKQIVVPENEIKLHALCISIGQRNSGKTCAVSSKLIHLKSENLCDRCWLISNTWENNYHYFDRFIAIEDCYDATKENLEEVLDKIREESDEYYDTLHKIELYNKFLKFIKSKKDISKVDVDLYADWVNHNIIDMYYSGEIPKLKYLKKPILHIVLDDIQGTRLLSPSSPIWNIVIKHRHIHRLGVSLWFLFQTYTAQSNGLSKVLRENATLVLVFLQKNRERVEQIAEEFSGSLEEQKFIDAYEIATKEDYGFLCVEFVGKKTILRKNWDILINFNK